MIWWPISINTWISNRPYHKHSC